MFVKNGWAVVYEKAIRPDGSLYFPNRLTRQILEEKRREQGSYIFANQYLNECIPDDARQFLSNWFKYYTELPDIINTFVFCDPAISQENDADHTAIVVVSVDIFGNYFVRAANRYRLTPTEIIKKIFEVNDFFKPNAIGIEDVAYQKALLYLIHEEMVRENKLIPIKGIRPDSHESKTNRILSLVPRIEWGKVYFNQGLTDLEDELLTFPRGKHDDLIDALAYIQQIAFLPTKGEPINGKDIHPTHPDYEREYIRKLAESSDGY
jgi:predicted phage terminase large subunit-like protein